MFKKKNILKLLFFSFPFFFIYSSFEPLKDSWQFIYIGKHVIVLLVFIMIIITYPINFKFSKNIKAAFFVLMIYIVYNFMINSSLSLASFYFVYSFMALVYISTKIPIIDNDKEFVLALYYGLLVFMLIAISYSLLYGRDLFKLTYTYNGMRLRWYFDFHNPSYLGAILLLIGILTIYLKKKNKISKVQCFIVLPITTILIVLTDSRNSIISLLIFYVSLNLKKVTKVTKIIFVLAIPFILYLLFVDYDTIDGLSSSRLTVWTETLNHNMQDLTISKFLFGVGLGNAKEIGFKKTFNANVEVYKDIFHADNFYLEIFIQFGFLGLLLLIILIVVLYIEINKKLILEKNKNMLNTIYFVMLFFGFFNSSFISVGSLLSIGLWMIFWETYFETIQLKYEKTLEFIKNSYSNQIIINKIR